MSGRAAVRVCVLLLALLPAVTQTAPAEETLQGEALVVALRQGGYNLYFRHAATDWTQQDRVTAAGDWTSCDPAEMRQLSPEGRETAMRVGRAIRALGIPVGPVLASEYCRAAETARALGLGPVETTRAIMNLRAAEYLGGRDAVVARARERLGQPPPAGTNAVLVAHGNLMRAATDHYVGEGGAGVFRPLPDGEFAFVAELTPEDWVVLAERYGAASG